MNIARSDSEIRDALHNLGITVDRNTVKRILSEHGIDPAPERRTGTPWKTFLEAHWEALAALDFFTVEVLTLVGIIRFHVLFAIRLETRDVQIVGITSQPYEEWMKQMARNLTDPFDGFLNDVGYLIMDREPLYTACFRKMLKESGTAPVRLPSRSPDLNAFAQALRLVNQDRVPEQDHPPWREASSPPHKGVYATLPHRAKPSGIEQQHHSRQKRRGTERRPRQNSLVSAIRIDPRRVLYEKAPGAGEPVSE